MRFRARPWSILLLLAAPAAAQIATPPPSGTGASPKEPPVVEGYVVTTEIRALAPGMQAPSDAAPEGQALLQQLKGATALVSRFWLAQDFSRQEILSGGFILPQGTLLLHKAGDRFFAIADPKQQTYLAMDAAQLLNALEGGAGIVNSAYQARVNHTQERKDIAGISCRKSILTVTYASSIPFENDRVLVQQKNDIEVWHSAELKSGAAMDHLFFKFHQDQTGAVKRVIEQDLGFPMEVSFVVTQAGAKKASGPQPGSFQMKVTELRKEKKLDGSLFRIPPAGYRRVERSPYFKN